MKSSQREDQEFAIALRAAALHAAAAMFPRVVTLKAKTNTVKIALFGCQGEVGEAQKRVADLMAQIHAEDPFTLGMILGDNVYKKGIRTPDAEELTPLFYDKYEKLLIRFIVALGNHDLALERITDGGNKVKFFAQYVMDLERGMDVGLNQIAHTFLKDVAKIFKLFSEKDIINIEELPTWTMPNDVFSYIIDDEVDRVLHPEIPDNRMQIFTLNTNTLGKEYIKWRLNPAGCKPGNQAKFYLEQFKLARALGRFIINQQHHGVVTVCKRAYEEQSDADLYLTEEEIIIFNQLVDRKHPDVKVYDPLDPTKELMVPRYTRCYNQLLHDFFEYEKAMPDEFCTAHDHSASRYHKGNTHQIGAGCGGGSTHPQEEFSHQENLGTYMKEHGVVSLTFDKRCPRESFKIDFFMLNGYHLAFDNKSHVPIQKITDNHTLCLCHEIINACQLYFGSLVPFQNKEYNVRGRKKAAYKMVNIFTVGFFAGSNPLFHDVKPAQDITNYLKQYELPEFDVVYAKIMELIDKLPNRDAGTLYKKLLAIMKKHQPVEARSSEITFTY